MFLDSKRDFKKHIKNVLNKVSKTIALLRKIQKILARSSLINIYKSFIRPHLDYGGIIYDQAYNVSFHQKLESIQYNVALAIGAIRRTSREKLCHELGFESLESRRWYRKLCCFYKIFKTQSPRHLVDILILICPSENSVFLCNNPKGMQLLTRSKSDSQLPKKFALFTSLKFL